MEKLLEPNKDNCVNPKSPLNTFNKISKDGMKILCSKECPCSGNPQIFQDDPKYVVIDLANGDDKDCVSSAGKTCLYVHYKLDMYNAQKCYDKKWKDEGKDDDLTND